jgi:hypothetical protein
VLLIIAILAIIGSVHGDDGRWSDRLGLFLFFGGIVGFLHLSKNHAKEQTNKTDQKQAVGELIR